MHKANLKKLAIKKGRSQAMFIRQKKEHCFTSSVVQIKDLQIWFLHWYVYMLMRRSQVDTGCLSLMLSTSFLRQLLPEPGAHQTD